MNGHPVLQVLTACPQVSHGIGNRKGMKDHLKHLMAVMLDMYEAKKAMAVVSEVTSMDMQECRRVEAIRRSS